MNILVVIVDKANVWVLLDIISVPKLHDHAKRAVRSACAASVSHVVMLAWLEPSAIRVVEVWHEMIETGSKVVASWHSASFKLPRGLIVTLLSLISKVRRASIGALTLLCVMRGLVTSLLILVVVSLVLLRVLLLLTALSLLLWSSHGVLSLFWSCLRSS